MNSSASDNSLISTGSYSLLPGGKDGISHALFKDFNPKNTRRAIAAYSPIGRAVQRNISNPIKLYNPVYFVSK
jgi:hypothetical protein